MAPIIQSESMAPTIQTGDGLELEDATDLQIGDVVVYRHDRLFICHRIHGIEGHRLFLRGDAVTGADEEIDVQQVVGRVDCVVRNGKRLDVRRSRFSPMGNQNDSVWSVAWTWSSQRARAPILLSINRIAGVPGINGLFRFILRRLMTITIMERVALQSLDGYVAGARVHLDQLRHHLLHPIGSDTLLVIHIGPAYIGICTLDPWRMQIRPFLHPFTTALVVETIASCHPVQLSPHSIRRATTAAENQ
ncbi:MAG: S24/S26 family peptidase [Nitrospira sp.]|nr:S24/S26 family peptidase [Nitrospira sp.]